MIDLRKNSIALRRGDLTWLKNSDENRVLAFLRRSGSEEVLVAINMTSTPFFGSVETSGSFAEITPSLAPPLSPDDQKAKASVRSKIGLPTLSLEAYGYRIFRRK